ncbi:WcaI family glycosyltransferase [Bradyrhizobium sp. 38]|uniref:WcaI family glycosyltransferase n=1 Tax=unclassified Bradyrhizobium TaxID=2631580 RepID=UPI001FF8AC5F|nr:MULTISPECIES: WcaI family glycosyltransferase [unclassified Bradyrhizobium]MCK1341643.1 WcaI family glycosyltransferase [Bradyrhizobium sp. 38]MCK1778826.1 WcaI family glycosyltransferase [Bradyrhizobium sp. 132]
MRVLLVGINYAPDLIGVAKYNSELCESLVAEGHEVRVITAPPYYPTWKIPPRFRSFYFRTRHIDGVRVTRTPIYVPGHPSGAKRLIHHASFALSSAVPVLVNALSWRPDVMIAVAPSLMSAAFVSLVARRVGAKSWLHIQDFEVDAAFDLGLLRNDTLRKWMLRTEAAILKSFDHVSTISQSMVDRLILKGVGVDKAVEVRNWIDTRAIRPASRMTRYREQLKLAETDIVALYSGTMSNKQGLELVIEAAIGLAQSHPHIRFILAGEGPNKTRLEQMAVGHTNVHFLGLQPNESFNELMATADFHLIPQKAEAADLVLPSKLGAIFASARPVIAMAEEGTGLAAEVTGAGLVIPPGDSSALEAALCQLSEAPALRRHYGEEGRKRALDRWDRQTIVRRWSEVMAGVRKPTGQKGVGPTSANNNIGLPVEDAVRLP